MTAKHSRRAFLSWAFWFLLCNQSAVAVEIHEIGEPAKGGFEQRGVASPAQVVPTAPQRVPNIDQRIESVDRSMSTSVLVDMARRQQELQAEVERLRGENEELNHTINGLQTRLRDMYSDLDRRMQSLEQRGGGAAPGAASSNDGTSLAITGDAMAERKAYERAFNLLREKRYDQAIQEFQRFLQSYPQSEFADNAQYWIGEGYYVTRDFREAAASFKTLIATYSQSSKLADAYLKLGFSQYELGHYPEARLSLNTVIKQHGKSTAARLAKERLERMSKEGR